MARIEVVMPQMGESITTGTITKWHKAVGDKIEIDEILLEISTDKVESEIPSPIGGRVASILFEEGETIDVGVLIAEIEDDDSVSLDAGASAPKKQDTPAAVAEVSTPVATATNSQNDQKTTRFYTPLVKALAQEHGVALNELENLTGSGAGGRVNKADFMNYISSRGSAPAEKSTATAAVAPSVSAAPVGKLDPSGRVEVIKMDNMRKMIAKNMVESKQSSPHVNSISEVDLTHLVKFREGFKNEFQKQEGFKLTYTPFIMWAIVQALKEYPLVNASVIGDEIHVKKDINLGCAVAVPGNGLIVPVIHDAASLNVTGIARRVNDLALKARAKKLTMNELQGGTFTFSNVGSFGTLMATPVILQPQVGIYASGVIQKRVMVMKDDAIAVRSMMYGTHAYDHRLIDGEMGGKFLESIHRHLLTMDPSAIL